MNGWTALKLNYFRNAAKN